MTVSKLIQLFENSVGIRNFLQEKKVDEYANAIIDGNNLVFTDLPEECYFHEEQRENYLTAVAHNRDISYNLEDYITVFKLK